MNKLLTKLIVLALRQRGYSALIAPVMVEAVMDDLFSYRKVSLSQKLWAYRRGFLSSRIKMYGLNDQNFADYLNDIDYFRLNPINGFFNTWMDSKLTMKYVLSPFDQYLPQYYYQLVNDGSRAVVLRLNDCPPGYGEELLEIVRLLENQGYLALKQIWGSRGAGFYKLVFRDGQYYINEAPLSQNEMIQFLQQLDKYIVTEYLFPHPDLGRIWDKTPNSIRIMTVRAEGQEPQIANAVVRFGTAASGAVDNVSCGGVCASVDVESGHFEDGRLCSIDEYIACPVHPDSQVDLEGNLPFWEQIKTTLLAICTYVPQLRYMGFDVVTTPDSVKIIEINAHPDIDFHNTYCPIYTNARCKDFFKAIIAEKIK